MLLEKPTPTLLESRAVVLETDRLVLRQPTLADVKAIARVVGETVIVAIAAGSTPNLTLWPLDTIQTMTGYMLQIGLGDAARGTVDYNSLFAVASTLFVLTFMLNVIASVVVGRYREAYE